MNRNHSCVLSNPTVLMECLVGRYKTLVISVMHFITVSDVNMYVHRYLHSLLVVIVSPVAQPKSILCVLALYITHSCTVCTFETEDSVS